MSSLYASAPWLMMASDSEDGIVSLDVMGVDTIRAEGNSIVIGLGGHEVSLESASEVKATEIENALRPFARRSKIEGRSQFERIKRILDDGHGDTTSAVGNRAFLIVGGNTLWFDGNHIRVGDDDREERIELRGVLQCAEVGFEVPLVSGGRVQAVLALLTVKWFEEPPGFGRSLHLARIHDYQAAAKSR